MPVMSNSNSCPIYFKIPKITFLTPNIKFLLFEHISLAMLNETFIVIFYHHDLDWKLISHLLREMSNVVAQDASTYFEILLIYSRASFLFRKVHNG